MCVCTQIRVLISYILGLGQFISINKEFEAEMYMNMTERLGIWIHEKVFRDHA